MASPSIPTPRNLPARGWRWAAWGAATGAVLVALSQAPARWLAWALHSASAGQVQLLQPRGTVWAGSALLTLAAGSGGLDRQSLPTRVQWALGLHWAHTWPGLRVALSSACCTPAGPLVWQASWQQGGPQLALQDQQSVWPIALLAGLGAPWNTLQAQGQLHWQSTGLQARWQGGQLHWVGSTTLEARDIASRLSALRPMGHYRLILEGQPNGTPSPSLTLSTVLGPLQLTGQGYWQGQRLRLNGEASADAGSEESLSNLLNIIGRRSGARSLFTLG